MGGATPPPGPGTDAWAPGAPCALRFITQAFPPIAQNGAVWGKDRRASFDENGRGWVALVYGLRKRTM